MNDDDGWDERLPTKPVVNLLGQDGNVYNVIGLTARAIRAHSGAAKAAEFRAKAFDLHSYDEVLRLVMEYCDVE